MRTKKGFVWAFTIAVTVAMIPTHAFLSNVPAEAGFSIILQIIEYGQRSVGVIIDIGETMKSSDLDIDTFRVWQHMAEWPGTSRERTAGIDGYRSVTHAYVNNEARMDSARVGTEEGRYIILELEHGYFLGSEDHTYDPASTRFALRYELTQEKPLGSVNAGYLVYVVSTAEAKKREIARQSMGNMV